MKTVDFDITVVEKASRLEPVISIFYGIPLAIVGTVLCSIATVAWIIQFFHIILLAKRNKALADFTVKTLKYCAKWEAYACFLTDERPPIMPED